MPVVVLLLIVALVGCNSATGTATKDMTDDSATGTVAGSEVRVVGKNFDFRPGELEVAAGQDVTVVLEAQDIAHDFVIKELGVHIEAKGGGIGRGVIKAPETGTYTYYCSISGHLSAGMKGTLSVD